jgi:hypothetical protein
MPGLALVPHLPAATSGVRRLPLRLNEIMAGPARDWDGSGHFSSRDDEWVEVVNTGGAPLDSALPDHSTATPSPRYAFSGTLAAGAHLVISARPRSTGSAHQPPGVSGCRSRTPATP